MNDDQEDRPHRIHLVGHHYHYDGDNNMGCLLAILAALVVLATAVMPLADGKPIAWIAALKVAGGFVALYMAWRLFIVVLTGMTRVALNLDSLVRGLLQRLWHGFWRLVFQRK